MVFKECAINCPQSSGFHAINMNNPKNEELRCYGYIRNLWKLSAFKNILYPPFDLKQIIRSYFCEEIIYLLDVAGNHWKINLDLIIANSE